MAEEMSTPVNTITRENIHVLIRNNILNDSLEFYSDCDGMETDSPVRSKTSLQPIIKKLFHSPLPEDTEECHLTSPLSKQNERNRRIRKRKQSLLPNSSEKIKKAYVKECEQDGYSPDLKGGMRKKVLISLFHNKEYSMDFS